MRIGLFVLETGRKVGGLEVYETNLVRALAREDSENQYHVFCLDPQVPDLLGVEASNFRFHILPAARYKGVLWNAPRAMARAKLDVMHALFVPPPITSVPYVFTCHGSEVLERPDFYPLALGLRMRVLFRRGLAMAGLVLCVSDYVRDYLMERRGIPRARLRTVYLACPPEFRPMDKAVARGLVARTFAVHGPYVLAATRIEPRKNPIRVLRAYDRFRRSLADPPRLVVVGMKTWSAREFDRTVRELELTDLVVEVGHVPEDALPALYAAAEFVLFASLWEGFGLPALQALATGVPLITSRTTSLPEITSGACLLVDPYSVDEITAAMRTLHENRALAAELARKGLERAAAFSWDRTARETLEAYGLVERRAHKDRRGASS